MSTAPERVEILSPHLLMAAPPFQVARIKTRIPCEGPHWNSPEKN